MRQAAFMIAFFFLLLGIAGCEQKDKSKIISQYKYEEDSNILTVKINNKLEPWVKKGVECFGIIMVCNKEGDPLRIKEVHVRVIDVQPKSVKMEALEDIVINRTTECRKVSFRKGQSWNEEYGEIFKTRAEATTYIDKEYPGLRIKR